MVADEVSAGRRNQRGQPPQQLGGLQQQHRAAVAQWPLEPIGEPPVGQLGEPLLRQRRAGAVAAEAREPLAVVGDGAALFFCSRAPLSRVRRLFPPGRIYCTLRSWVHWPLAGLPTIKE